MKHYFNIFVILFLFSFSTKAAVTATSNSPICVGDSIKLFATGGAGATFFWHGPAGFTSTLQNPVIAPASLFNGGTYTVVETIAGVKDSTTITIVISTVHPPVPIIGVVFPTCTGKTMFLSATDTPGVTWSWTGPNGFTSTLANPTIPSVTILNQGNYIVTVDYNGCKASQTVYAIVDSTPATPTVTNNGPLCQTDTTLLHLFVTTATPGATYTWTGPDTFFSVLQNPTRFPATPAMTGYYSVIVRITYGSFSCYDSVFTYVNISPTPPKPSVSSNSPVCQGGTLNLSIFGGDITSTYYWVGPASSGYSSNVQDPSIPTVSLNYTGQYVAWYVSSGCASPKDTINVVIDTTPAHPTISYNPPVCQGDTLKFFTIEADSNMRYQWSGPAGFTSTSQNPFIYPAVPPETGRYTVVVEPGHCSDSAKIDVIITPTPTLAISSNSPVCEGDTLRFNAVTDPGATITWSGPLSFASGSTTPYRGPAIVEYSGTYRITVIGNGGCVDTVYDNVVINPTPGLPMTNWLYYCQGYDAPPLEAGGSNLLWYANDLPGTVGSVIAPTPSTAAIGANFYYLTQTVNGCISPLDSMEVTVYPKPKVSVSPPIYLCPGDTAQLTVVDTEKLAPSYHWSPATYLLDTNLATTTIVPITSGVYTVIGTNKYGCMDTAYTEVHVYPAAVIYTGDSATLYPGETLKMRIESNCTSFKWFPPETLDNATEMDPTASPHTDIKYFVSGVTQYGCKTIDSISVHLAPASVLALPNAFTPGNGPNSVFRILTKGIITLKYFRVFDRWGVMLFETTDINQGWDGAYKGQPQPFGVYVYEAEATASGTDGKDILLKGNVTLLR